MQRISDDAFDLDPPAMPTPRLPTGSNPRSRRILAVVLLVPLAIAMVAGWLAYRAPYHFDTVQTGVLYRSGNPSLRRIKIAIDEGHIHTIVALLDDQEFADPKKPQFAQEKAYAESHGIQYLRIPVRLGGWPSSEQLRQFLKIAADPADQPVLVDSAQGVRRTGMFVSAFEESQLGWSADKTAADIDPFGHGPNTVENIKEFIERYDPKSESFSANDLGKGATD